MKQPNIVLIVADDLGYDHLGGLGAEGLCTPHIDSIGTDGVTFTSMYSNGALCSPTRAALMTGAYQQRSGILDVINAQQREGGLACTNLASLPRVLKSQNYATALFGKWHLGYQQEHNPINFGFDYFRGYIAGNVDYFSHVDQAGYLDWHDGKNIDNEEGYTTDLITAHGIKFIDHYANKKPFMLYLAHEAPHYPYQTRESKGFRTVKTHDGEQTLAQLDLTREEEHWNYKRMIEAMDDGVGQILEALDRNGIAENTLVVFISDNGYSMTTHITDTLRGSKGNFYEGGIRVPGLMRFPKLIQPNTVCDTPVMTMDFLPTFAVLAGAEIPPEYPIDGVDLTDLLNGHAHDKYNRDLFWHDTKMMAVQSDGYKLVSKGECLELFYIKTDIAEKINLSADMPEKVQELSDKLKTWVNLHTSH